jgi:hypothetical protein
MSNRETEIEHDGAEEVHAYSDTGQRAHSDILHVSSVHVQRITPNSRVVISNSISISRRTTSRPYDDEC